MKSRNNAVYVLVVILALSAAMGTWEFQAARAARAELASANWKREKVALEKRALQESIGKLDREMSRIKDAPPPEAPLKGVDTPEQLQHRTRVLKAWLSLKFAPFYRKAGLSPGQVSQLDDLLVNHFMRTQDIAATAQAENLPYTDPVIKKLGKDEFLQTRSEENALLGPQVTDQLFQFQRTAAVSSLADAVAGNTFYAEPLGASQAEQLTQILANNSAGYQKGGFASPDDVDYTTAVAQAQGFLTPTQLAALRNLYEGQQAGKQLFQLLGNPPAPTTAGSSTAK